MTKLYDQTYKHGLTIFSEKQSIREKKGGSHLGIRVLSGFYLDKMNVPVVGVVVVEHVAIQEGVERHFLAEQIIYARIFEEDGE